MSGEDVIDCLVAELDKDKSGTVSAKELMEGLGDLGVDVDTVKAFIKDHDKNGDGQLDANEIKQFFKNLL
ncbi:unnamed protein product [Rodentolepis nana]|uniref:EF-hand domain-containing protein n=1 Tax=Rodentolepis nana TaxID=102285 RepID=A0A0R3TB15_RODNA|nr:unnamed protein product [Rodentolepis nana]